MQSNKTRPVAEHFDWVQSVDRLKIAQRLSEQRPPELAPLQVCLQVNIDGGANKSGLAPEDVLALAEEVARLPRLVLRGLMAIPEPAIDFVAACAVHASAKAMFDQINAVGRAGRADGHAVARHDGRPGSRHPCRQHHGAGGTAIFGGRG